MADHKNCKYYAVCNYRTGVGECPDRCVQYKHKDAVIVVRCKNCKKCKLCYPEKQIGKEATPGWYCKEHKSYRRPDDFCSYGERREGE